YAQTKPVPVQTIPASSSSTSSRISSLASSSSRERRAICLITSCSGSPAKQSAQRPRATGRPSTHSMQYRSSLSIARLRVLGLQPLGPAPGERHEPALAQRAAPPLPAAMQHAVANGVEQNRLHTVPPDDGVNLHRAERRV